MAQRIGPREQQLRDIRAAQQAKPARETIVTKLPKTSGKKPVKRKGKKR